MARTISIFVALALLLLLVHVTVPLRGPSRAIPDGVVESGLLLGAYDPHRVLAADSRIQIDHVFIGWEDEPASHAANARLEAERRNRRLLVSVEPWAPEDLSTAAYFDSIVQGDFDGRIAELCAALRPMGEEALIRWGHEMERDTGRYPWAALGEERYVMAYRHFVAVCRTEAPAARFVWSPLGEDGLEAYWPGDEYVDVIGLSLFGLQRHDEDFFDGPRSLSESLGEKYERVRPFDMPVIVAEFGVAGDRQYRLSWLEALAAQRRLFPLLEAVVYFNDREPYSWPGDYGSPDWRISS